MCLQLVFPAGICQQRWWCIKHIASESGFFINKGTDISSFCDIKIGRSRITDSGKPAAVLGSHSANPAFSAAPTLTFLLGPVLLRTVWLNGQGTHVPFHVGLVALHCFCLVLTLRHFRRKSFPRCQARRGAGLCVLLSVW